MSASTAHDHRARGRGLRLSTLTRVLRGVTGRCGSACGLALAGAVLLLEVAAGPAAAAGSVWRWPLEPTPAVLTGFAAPVDPYGPGSRGVDLAAAVGQPVLAAASGTVAFAGLVAGSPVVTVRHALIVTTYEPVIALVEIGQAVTAGGELGTVAALPRLCGTPTCLHWGAYLPGSVPRRYLNPVSLLGAGPVRLLPDGVPRVPDPAQPLDTPQPNDAPPPAESRPAPSRPAAIGQPQPGSAVRAQSDPARRAARAPTASTSGGRTGAAASRRTSRSHHGSHRVIAATAVVGGGALLAPMVLHTAGAGLGRRSHRRARHSRRLR